MSCDPIVVEGDTSLARVSALMQEHHIKRIPVMRDGVLVGIVSRADLLKAIVTADQDETASGDEAIRRSIATRLSEMRIFWERHDRDRHRRCGSPVGNHRHGRVQEGGARRCRKCPRREASG